MRPSDARLVTDTKSGTDPEDSDGYCGLSGLWVPPEARWQQLKDRSAPAYHRPARPDGRHRAPQPGAQRRVPKDYPGPALNKTRLGRIIAIIRNIKAHAMEAAS